MFAPNITKQELIYSDTAKRLNIDNEPSPEHEKNLVRVSWFLQSLRYKLNKKFPNQKAIIRISSGYRGPALNKAVGGSQTSDHMKGLAADFTCNILTPYELAKFIVENMVEEGFDQVIQEFNQWVHIGLADSKHPKLEALTAYKENGKTKYKPGIHRG